MKREISARSQQTINWVKKKRINPEPIIDYYGLRFFLNFVKSLTKKDRKGPLTTEIDYPNFKCTLENRIKAREAFLIQLEECGFKLKGYYESFVDEDNGEIVDVPRHKIYFLGVKPSK